MVGTNLKINSEFQHLLFHMLFTFHSYFSNYHKFKTIADVYFLVSLSYTIYLQSDRNELSIQSLIINCTYYTFKTKKLQQIK